MKLLGSALLAAGFCLGTVGAAGFGAEVERGAWAALIGGLALLVIGGSIARVAGRARAQAGAPRVEARARFAAQLEGVVRAVRAIEAEKDRVEPAEVRRRVDLLLEGEVFDLVQRHEELQALLGFDAYARVWDGVATGERLLNRVWTMLTDGWSEQALEELAIARAQLERASVALASV